MIELFLNLGVYFVLVIATVYFIKRTWIENSNGYLAND